MRTIGLKYRAAALLTACLMLVSSTGFAVDMHFCQDMLKSVRLIGEAPNCHEQAAKSVSAQSCHKLQQAPACHSKTETVAIADCQKDCCSHEVVLAQLDSDFLKTENTPVSLKTFTAYILSEVFIRTYTEAAKSFHKDYLHYKPPSPDKDIPVLVQSFLI